METVYSVEEITDLTPPTYSVCNPEWTHKVLCLSHTVQKFSNRVEVRFDTGGGLGVSLFPNAIAAYQALKSMKDNLVVFKSEQDDTTVYETTEGANSVSNGIAFQRSDKSFRVHIAVMGQYIMFLVDSQKLLLAFAELGGDPERFHTLSGV